MAIRAGQGISQIFLAAKSVAPIFRPSANGIASNTIAGSFLHYQRHIIPTGTIMRCQSRCYRERPGIPGINSMVFKQACILPLSFLIIQA